MVRGPEREAGGKEDIGQDQIQEEDVCHCAELLILVDDDEDKPVAKVTQEEIDIVENWDEFCTKFIDTILVTELDSFTDHVALVSRLCGVKQIQKDTILVISIVHGCGLPVERVQNGQQGTQEC